MSVLTKLKRIGIELPIVGEINALMVIGLILVYVIFKTVIQYVKKAPVIGEAVKEVD